MNAKLCKVLRKAAKGYNVPAETAYKEINQHTKYFKNLLGAVTHSLQTHTRVLDLGCERAVYQKLKLACK